MKIPYLSPEKIDQEVQAVLSKYYARYSTSLPIKAEQFLETEYGLRIIPIPGLSQFSIKCYLSLDCTSVIIDKAAYDHPGSRVYDGIRYSFGHEIGHLHLHKHLLEKAIANSNSNYPSFLENFNEKEHKYIESQANMFSARYLIPTNNIMGRLAARLVENLDLLRDNKITLQGFASFITPQLATEFGVSNTALGYRISHLDFSKFTESSDTNVLISELDIGLLKAALSSSEEEGLFGLADASLI